MNRAPDRPGLGPHDEAEGPSDAGAAVRDAIETLQTLDWRETLQMLRQRFSEDRLGLTASSLTFTTTIALVPLITVMLAVFSAFPMFSRFQSALETYFLQSLVPDTIARPVIGALTQFAAKANQLGTAGVVILMVTALALMLTIDRTLNAIWRVRTPRPIGQRILVYWAAATLGPLLLGVSLSMTSYAVSQSRGLVEDLPGAVNLLLNVLEFGMLALAMAGLFHFVPNTAVRWRHALIGGVFVALAFEGAKKALAWYLTSVPTYSVIYGAFATVPIFLVWMYLGWVIVLLGAVIAAYLPTLRMRVVRRPDAPGFRFLLAVLLLRELAAVRRDGAHGVSLESLAMRLRTDPLQVEPVLDTMASMNLVGRLDEAGPARYVLLGEPERLPAAPLLAQWLVAPDPVLEGFRAKAGLDRLTVADLLA